MKGELPVIDGKRIGILSNTLDKSNFSVTSFGGCAFLFSYRLRTPKEILNLYLCISSEGHLCLSHTYI